jgi:hypothetical protein
VTGCDIKAMRVCADQSYLLGLGKVGKQTSANDSPLQSRTEHEMKFGFTHKTGKTDSYYRIFLY